MGRHKQEEAKEKQSRGKLGAEEKVASLSCGHEGVGA